MRKESIEKAEKALAFIENGLTQKEACRRANLSQITYCTYMKKNKKSPGVKVKNKVMQKKDLFMVPQHLIQEADIFIPSLQKVQEPNYSFLINQLKEENRTLKMFIKQII
jgi:transcriptional regulator with XRE-family HTH domain